MWNSIFIVLAHSPQYTILEQKCAHPCSNVVNCGMLDWCIVWFVSKMYKILCTRWPHRPRSPRQLGHAGAQRNSSVFRRRAESRGTDQCRRHIDRRDGGSFSCFHHEWLCNHRNWYIRWVDFISTSYTEQSSYMNILEKINAILTVKYFTCSPLRHFILFDKGMVLYSIFRVIEHCLTVLFK